MALIALQNCTGLASDGTARHKRHSFHACLAGSCVFLDGKPLYRRTSPPPRPHGYRARAICIFRRAFRISCGRAPITDVHMSLDTRRDFARVLHMRRGLSFCMPARHPTLPFYLDSYPSSFLSPHWLCYTFCAEQQDKHTCGDEYIMD